MIKAMQNKFLVWILVASLLQFAFPTSVPAQEASKAITQVEPPPALPRQQFAPPPISGAEDIDTPGAILDYTVGINDVLAVNIWSSELRFNQDVAVPLEGRIFLPAIGEIEVAGLTTSQIKSKIHRLVQARGRSASVSVLLLKTHTIRVYVTGLVRNPGAHSMNALARFSTALSAAGGVPPEGSLRRITLQRGSQSRPIDWLRFLRFGDISQNPRLKGGDIIVVPPAAQVAGIAGAVNKPGIYEFLPGETVAALIDFANGLKPDATLSQATLGNIPLDATQKGVERPIDLTTARGRQTLLTHRDMVNIPPNTLAFIELPKTRVQIVGEVKKPGEYVLTLGYTLRDFFATAGGPKPGAGLREVKIYRRSTAGAIRFEDAKVVDAYRLLYENDESQNVQLQDGDLVAVPINKDPTEDSAVYVFGHVGKPGKIPYRSGYHLSDYLNAAGGPLPKANLGGVTITRGSQRQKIPVDAHKIMYEGRQELDLVLQEGDIVLVPEAFFFASNWQDIVNVIFTGVAVWSIFRR